jgi:AGCS family alanine or glycine:cation symporter
MYGLLMPGVQANSITSGLQNAFGISPVISEIALVVVLRLTIFGGVKRIAKVAEIVVPSLKDYEKQKRKRPWI